MRKMKRNPLLAGLPVIGFCVVGSLIVSSFQGEKYQRLDMRNQTKTEKQFELEEEYDRIMSNMDIHEYELKPIKRN